MTSYSIRPAACKLREYAIQDHHAKIEKHITLENVLEPIFWANKLNEFRVGDNIECQWEGMERRAELMVHSIVDGKINVRLLNSHDFTSAVVPEKIEEPSKTDKIAKAKAAQAA